MRKTIALHRRSVLAFAAILALPRLAVAQVAPERRRVSFLLSTAYDEPMTVARLAAMKARLGELGWVDGRVIEYEALSCLNDPVQRKAMAKQIVARTPDLIITGGVLDAQAILSETQTIPLVFSTAADPVSSGFVQSLVRPGGNATGFTTSHPSMGSKWLEILLELAPRVKRVGVIFNPLSAPRNGDYYLDPLREMASSFGVDIIPLPISDPDNISAQIARLGGAPAGGLVVTPDAFTVLNRKAIVSAVAANAVPAVYSYHFFMTEGGLVSYGFKYESAASERSELVEAMVEYIDLILRGAKPAELPVRSPRTYQLIINLKTARSLNLTVPPVLLARADKIIE
jgi:putative ABC transport system substrate-binding protein